MKDTIFIIIFGLLIYLGFATLLGDNSIMGSYGATFAKYNHNYFGYMSYIYIFASLIPLYLFYKNTVLNIRKFELAITSFLVFFSFLLAQALLVNDKLRGNVGADFVEFLSPYIGSFGLWIFWLIITIVSLVIILDKSAHELVDIFLGRVKNKIAFKKNTAKNQKSTIVEKRVSPVHVEKPKEVKKVHVTQEIEKVEEKFEQEIDKPAYLRKEERSEVLESSVSEANLESKQETPHNILELVHEIKEQSSAIVVEELEENAKLLASIEKGEVEKPKNFTLPSVDFLQKPNSKAHSVDESELDDKIGFLIEKLAHFKIDGDVVRTYAGPVVSTFEFKPAANVKVSKILNLQDDLAMALSAETIRIQAPIPGKDVVGIEIPNATVDTIYLRDLLDSQIFKESSSPLTIVLGKDIVGKPFITDLKKLPHLLIAGTTGSGKSVGINAMILSLLYKNSPDQLRLLMIDPKMLEFSIYNDIPHLLTPVITKPKQAIVALNNMVFEMERRYELMSENRTKNIENYNEKVKKEGGEHFPYIVVIIDELADLMMTSGKDVEHSIARLAQMARASGIHLVVATQRPSVDVVTGLIKANLPSRISYRVGQRIDSKIILDQQGAESLLGKGDMLFTPPGSTGLVRLHAPWSTEAEIENIVEFIKSQRAPNYDKSFLVEENEFSNSTNETYEELDELYNDARNVILSDRKTSISYLQRKLQIGYNRSARIIEQLENEGVLSSPNTKGIREIL
ncbi:DNA translocase FtsK 4TM domain-containing protein [Candidatus Sulfurimonas marisnigri]|uniref:DNA translocase FtsK 4TM domain-containing protein n=1 Tax=Candidatus Sulfurimonas marisnigri TaxID=2740405 RepID=A0A7S7RPP5_9BACT|nr:DNA translocase FtsK 4TM domain-containing protein [Candidatus Sulfurimonas marisnigri]QOY53625.1 DNA translocase FtsK 4TM domain-containing protein [Candidatus Sulfurimonas marisnigri]